MSGLGERNSGWDDGGSFDELAEELGKVEVASRAPRLESLGHEEEARDLFVAARSGDVERLALMLRRGVHDPNEYDEAKLTPLSVAVQCGNQAAVRLLLEHGASPEVKDLAHGWTALHWAASEGDAPMVGLLVACGADVHAVDDARDTPLSEALRGGHVEVATRLLDARASVLARGMPAPL